MIKHTHGEKRHTIRGMGLARRKPKPCKRSVLRKSCTFIEIFFRNRLTKSRRDGKIYRQSAVAVKIESGRVPEWPMGTDCKSAAFQLRWFESTRAHQEVQYPNRVLDFLFCRLFSGLGGRIRTAAALSQKTAQKQPGGLFLAARLAQSTRAHPSDRSRVQTHRGCFIFVCAGVQHILEVEKNGACVTNLSQKGYKPTFSTQKDCETIVYLVSYRGGRQIVPVCEKK